MAGQYRLTVKQGVVKPSTLMLESKTRISLGTSGENDMVVASNQVSPNHCSLQLQGSDWILNDSSLNGIQVNGQDIDRKVLATGDHITLAPDVVLAFEDLTARARSSGAGQKSPNGDKAQKKPMIKGIPNGYLVAIIGVYSFTIAIFIGNWNKQPDGVVSDEKLKQAIQESRNCLKSAAATRVGSNSVRVDSADLSYRYHSLLAQDPQARSASDIDNLVSRQEELLRLGIMLEQQARKNDAAAAYRTAKDLLPNPACGGTGLALSRLDQLDIKEKK